MPCSQGNYTCARRISRPEDERTIQSCHSPARGVGEEYFVVTKVVNGDTFWIDDGKKKGRKVRLIGVDAPETRRTARKRSDTMLMSRSDT